MKKPLAYIVLAAVLLVAGFYAFNAYIYAQKQGNPAEVTSYHGTLSGEVVCLPYRGDGPHTMECAIGLRTDVGEHYVLDFTASSRQQTAPETGTRFTASGRITPIEMLSGDRWKTYDVVGVFSVTDSWQDQ